MSKIRQIVKLHARGTGKRTIARTLGMSKNTVKVYLDKYSLLQTPADELLKLSDYELNNLFHPPELIPLTEKLKQLHEFFPRMEKKLGRRGMTISMQFDQYLAEHPDGYRETQFYHYYRQWLKKVKPSMHIEHKVGEKVYVDFAGATLPYVEEGTGEIRQAQVFVAILGWSQYAYVEAVRDQSVTEFIAGCENALQYYRGVPMAIVPDNLKSAVFKACKYEPALNENFKAFGDHYGIAILPARVRRPKDKSHVENMVKIAYQRIYTKLPEKKILTLQQLNIAIRQHLKVNNDTRLTGMDCSRTDRWLMERPSLQPLPVNRYEMMTIKQVTVMKNGHVYLTKDQHYYSVPYQLIGKKLKMQYSRSHVELHYKYKLVATHKRLRSPHNYTTEPSHLAPSHQQMGQWSPAFFKERARAIDPAVEHYISQVLDRKKHPEQAYKSCQGILSFAKRTGHDRLIKACKRADAIGYYNYKTIEDILMNHHDQLEDEAEDKQMPLHENLRGSKYYQ